jgi:predicted phage terminase large subunit-like protein
VSYSHELGATFARQFRAVVTSDWYRALFPHMRLAKDTEIESVTTKGGGRFVVPVGGSFTGRGADVIIIDDPMKADEAQSDKARRATNDWYATALLSRLDDKEKGAIILVMQRLHEDDLAGKLLREGGWHHLDLPAIAEEDQEVAIGPGEPHRRKKGDVLHPAREPLAVLEAIRREMGSLTFSAQYQQRPIPLEGNLVKRGWIKWYEHAPNRDSGAQVVQSWDVASTTGSTNDWSVCTTWLVVKRNYYLLNVWRGRLEFPQLKRKLIDLAIEHKPNTILIEQAGPGLHLIQEFRANPVTGVPLPIGIKPENDKLVRMEAQSARFEAGQVHLPKDASWLGDFLHEILAFPNSRHDDQTDSVSQFLNWAEAHCRPMSFAPPIIITRPREDWFDYSRYYR